MTSNTESYNYQNPQFNARDKVVITTGVRKGLCGAVLENLDAGYYYVEVEVPEYNNRVKVVCLFSEMKMAESK